MKVQEVPLPPNNQQGVDEEEVEEGKVSPGISFWTLEIPVKSFTCGKSASDDRDLSKKKILPPPATCNLQQRNTDEASENLSGTI